MSLPDLDPAANTYDPAVNETYEGEVYAFNATGGYTMERGFDTIKLAEQTAPVHVDVTNAIQVTMDVAYFNELLDLTSFNPVTDAFGVDDITITAEKFTEKVANASQVISVGKYATLYSDFQAYVAAYFGSNGGFSSLFAAASEFAIDKDEEADTANVFNGASFIALLNSVETHADGHYTSELTGSINIANIAKLLKYTVDGNVFGNRDPELQNWGVENGFVAGDLIWVPSGTTVTLKLAIDPEALAPLNNVGSSYGEVTATTQQSSFNGLFSLNTTASTELITRVATAPLLIKLVTV